MAAILRVFPRNWKNLIETMEINIQIKRLSHFHMKCVQETFRRGTEGYGSVGQYWW